MKRRGGAAAFSRWLRTSRDDRRTIVAEWRRLTRWRERTCTHVGLCNGIIKERDRCERISRKVSDDLNGSAANQYLDAATRSKAEADAWVADMIANRIANPARWP